jgi:hypothetical protein
MLFQEEKFPGTAIILKNAMSSLSKSTDF